MQKEQRVQRSCRQNGLDVREELTEGPVWVDLKGQGWLF